MPYLNTQHHSLQFDTHHTHHTQGMVNKAQVNLHAARHEFDQPRDTQSVKSAPVNNCHGQHGQHSAVHRWCVYGVGGWVFL